MVVASGLCTSVYTLALYFCRVKLKHFEKFQDTTEALAGELTPFLQKKLPYRELVHLLPLSLLCYFA